MKAVINRLKNRIGSSMVEMLATVVLLGIMGLALVVGVSTIQKTYSQIVRKANEQTLLSTTLIEMRNAINKSVDYKVVSGTGYFKSEEGYWFMFRPENTGEKGIRIVYYMEDETGFKEIKSMPVVIEEDGDISNVYSTFSGIQKEKEGVFKINGLKVGNEDTGWTELKNPNEYYVRQIIK